jgi:hypothetical protein
MLQSACRFRSRAPEAARIAGRRVKHRPSLWRNGCPARRAPACCSACQRSVLIGSRVCFAGKVSMFVDTALSSRGHAPWMLDTCWRRCGSGAAGTLAATGGHSRPAAPNSAARNGKTLEKSQFSALQRPFHSRPRISYRQSRGPQIPSARGSGCNPLSPPVGGLIWPRAPTLGFRISGSSADTPSPTRCQSREAQA